MLRTLLETTVGALLGGALGAAMAGPLGGVLGALLGSLVGSFWRMGSRSFARAPSAAGVVREPHDLMCIPKGELAHCTLVRDAATGAWLDVEECSLCEHPDHVLCTKRCLVMLEDAEPAKAGVGAAAG